MIRYIWYGIQDGISEFLFFFRKLFCKHYCINSFGIGLCEIHHTTNSVSCNYTCEKCYWSKRKGGDE